jgi:hypothetical protein
LLRLSRTIPHFPTDLCQQIKKVAAENADLVGELHTLQTCLGNLLGDGRAAPFSPGIRHTVVGDGE